MRRRGGLAGFLGIGLALGYEAFQRRVGQFLVGRVAALVISVAIKLGKRDQFSQVP